MQSIRNPNCTPADLHKEMVEYCPEDDPDTVNHEEAAVMEEAGDLIEPDDIEDLERDLDDEVENVEEMDSWSNCQLLLYEYSWNIEKLR